MSLFISVFHGLLGFAGAAVSTNAITENGIAITEDGIAITES